MIDMYRLEISIEYIQFTAVDITKNQMSEKIAISGIK